MKNYWLIILLVLATVICSVLCRQTARSNERLRRQIDELEAEIQQPKKPNIVARNPQSIQNQADVTAPAAHAANAELRKEKRVLEKQVGEVRSDILKNDLAAGRLRKSKRRITPAELEKLDPAAFAQHYNPENRQTMERLQREKIEQRTNFLSTMNPSCLSPEENEHLKAYVQLLNQATEMKLRGEEVPVEMFAEYRGIRQLIEKYCVAAIGSDNPSLPIVQQSLRQWSSTPSYRALSPYNPYKLKIKGEPKP
jgi:cell division septum initiation protein DivIVA